MTPTRRRFPPDLLLLLCAIPSAVAVLLLWATGVLDPPSAPGIAATDPLARWGLPIAAGLRDVAAAITIGCLVVMCFCLPAHEAAPVVPAHPGWARLVRTIVVSSAVWSASGLATLIFTYGEASALSLSETRTWVWLGSFVVDFEIGRYLLIGSALALAVSLGASHLRSTGGGGVLLLLALAALWPLALTGHSAGALNHAQAVESQALHMLGVSVWMGGLLATVMVAPLLVGDVQLQVLRRYSTFATWSFAAVLLSGLLSASLRITSWGELNSPYGVMLGAKVVAVSVLGAAGWWQRKRLLHGLAGHQRGSMRLLVLGEIAVMAATMGVGVALGKTPPPSAREELPLSPAESLLGHEVPGPLNLSEWFSAWRLDGLWTGLAIALLIWYWLRVFRLRHRGDYWSLGKSLAWTIGCLLLIWATSGAPGVYGRVMFSMHMVQHMTIATAVPIFMVLGAPLTLLLRSSPSRNDGSYGAREWALRLLRSPLLQLMSHPLVAASVFIVSLVAFYYGGGLEVSLASHTAHVLMVAHFLLAGYLFANSVVGTDPVQSRPPYPLRMLLVMIVFAFHAFLSVSLMASNQVLARDWFSIVRPEWGATLERDQYLGASIGWALGDYPLAIIAGALVWQWFRADHAEQRRFDRREERDNDAELVAYNAQLQRIAAEDSRRLPDQPDG